MNEPGVFTVTKWKVIRGCAGELVLKTLSFLFADAGESIRIEGARIGVVLVIVVRCMRGSKNKGSGRNDGSIGHINVPLGKTGEGCYTQCGVSVGS